MLNQCECVTDPMDFIDFRAAEGLNWSVTYAARDKMCVEMINKNSLFDFNCLNMHKISAISSVKTVFTIWTIIYSNVLITNCLTLILINVGGFIFSEQSRAHPSLCHLQFVPEWTGFSQNSPYCDSPLLKPNCPFDHLCPIGSVPWYQRTSDDGSLRPRAVH